jgi:lipoic acid synthetase
VLVPDFGGSLEAVKMIMDACPDVINHNIETVPRLYPKVRPGADMLRSLRLLETVKKLNPVIATKSGLMVGLGESRREVVETLVALRNIDCDFLTIGQYLQPSPEHYPVIEYIKPNDFQELDCIARDLGFKGVAVSPLTRSSHNAASLYQDASLKS